MKPAGRLADRVRATSVAGGAVLLGVLAGQTVLAWLALAGVCALLIGRRQIAWWPAYAVVVITALLNSLKWPESDLADYFRFLDEAGQVGLWDLLAEELPFLSIRATEPLFRASMWVLANAVPAPRVAFAWLAGLAVYGSALLLCRWSTCGKSSAEAALQSSALATAAALLLGLTFSLTGHLVRQYLAGGLFFIGAFGLAFGGRWPWLLLCAAACAVHNSALLLAGPLSLAWLLQRRQGWLAAVLATATAAALAGAIPLLDELAEASSFLKDDGSIGIWLPLLDLSVLAATTVAWRHTQPHDRPPQQGALLLLGFGLSLAVLLFCLREVPLLFFRSYFFLEFLRVPMLAFLIATLLRRAGSASTLAAVAVLTLSLVLFWLRTQGTDWEYSHPSALWPESLDLHSMLARWAAIERASL